MKKVLIIGPDFFNYHLSVEKAFKNLGFETKVIAYYGGAVTSWKERMAYHLSGNKSSFLENKKKQYNETVFGLYESFKPDLIFIIQGSDLYKDTVEKMKVGKKVLWMYDSIFRNKGGFGLRYSVDHLFVFENSDVPKLWETEKIKAWFLPSALDEAVYFPTNKTNEIDILFVGTLYKERIDLLEKVCAEFKDYNIKIYGYYYSALRKPFYHLFRKNKHTFQNKNIVPSFANELYNKSKICINMHQAQNKHGANQRFFEICGSRGFQLTDTNEYIEANFPGDEIMIYKSIPELFEKIDMVLKNKVDIDKMAGKAYQKVISTHTFTHRMKYVLDVINA